MINENNSWPRKYGLILIIIVVVMFVLMVLTWSRAEEQRRLTARHHLLCEVLQPGMSKDMVLGILKQVGEVRDLDYESQGPEMQIYFVDEKIRETYGVFELAFLDNRYYSAYVRGFDTYDVICEFETPTATFSP